jgi:hypothetical protein
MGPSDSLGQFLRAVRHEKRAPCRHKEWRLEAAMVGKDGFQAAFVRLASSSDFSPGRRATDERRWTRMRCRGSAWSVTIDDK